MRKQRPRGATTREAVINAGLAVVDEVGVEALTIRNVAKRVGAPAMTLYTHFDTKEQLLDLMYEEVARQLYIDHGNTTWQTEIQALCRQIRSVMVEHPKWAPLLIRPVRPLAGAQRERILAMMITDGMSADRAFSAIAAANMLAFGLTLAELTLVTPEGESSAVKRFERVKEWVASVPRGEYPATRAALAETPHFTLEQNLEFTVLTFIRGLEAEQAAEALRRTAD